MKTLNVMVILNKIKLCFFLSFFNDFFCKKININKGFLAFSTAGLIGAASGSFFLKRYLDEKNKKIKNLEEEKKKIKNLEEEKKLKIKEFEEKMNLINEEENKKIKELEDVNQLKIKNLEDENKKLEEEKKNLKKSDEENIFKLNNQIEILRKEKEKIVELNSQIEILKKENEKIVELNSQIEILKKEKEEVEKLSVEKSLENGKQINGLNDNFNKLNNKFKELEETYLELKGTRKEEQIKCVNTIEINKENNTKEQIFNLFFLIFKIVSSNRLNYNSNNFNKQKVLLDNNNKTKNFESYFTTFYELKNLYDSKKKSDNFIEVSNFLYDDKKKFFLTIDKFIENRNSKKNVYSTDTDIMTNLKLFNFLKNEFESFFLKFI